MSKFDPTKPVQTRDGRAVRILATDALNPTYPIVGLVTLESGKENVETFTADGRTYAARAPGSEPGNSDLVNVPERQTVFVNLGDAYIVQSAAERASREWAVVKLEVQGDKVISSEVVRNGKVT